MPLDRSLISGLPAFAGLAGPDLDTILATARSCRFVKDTEVFSQAAEAEQFFLLLSVTFGWFGPHPTASR